MHSTSTECEAPLPLTKPVTHHRGATRNLWVLCAANEDNGNLARVRHIGTRILVTGCVNWMGQALCVLVLSSVRWGKHLPDSVVAIVHLMDLVLYLACCKFLLLVNGSFYCFWYIHSLYAERSKIWNNWKEWEERWLILIRLTTALTV